MSSSMAGDKGSCELNSSSSPVKVSCGGQAVSPTMPLQQATSPTQPSTLTPSSEPPTNSPVQAPPAPSIPDLKVIYINKPDSDIKPSPTLSLPNGMSPKVVQLPGAGTTSGGFAYFGTIIKQGKDISEGQKVLLTPVIKDGGRFILPRPGVGQRSGVAVSPSQPSQIILTSPNTQRTTAKRSILIHSPALSGLESKGVKVCDGTVNNNNSGAVVPKVLPPPKVPLLVCSRPNDVTLTSVKSQSSTTPEKEGQPPLREVPPLALINQLSTPPLVNNIALLPSNTDNDDVELVGDGDMPRPIATGMKVAIGESCSPISIPDSPGSLGEDSNQAKDAEAENVPLEPPPKVRLIDKSGDPLTCKVVITSSQSLAPTEKSSEKPETNKAPPNGHFVRILSSSGGEPTNKRLNTVVLKDGKAVLVNNPGWIESNQTSDIGSTDSSTPAITNGEGEPGSKETSIQTYNRLQKTFPLMVASNQSDVKLADNIVDSIDQTKSVHGTRGAVATKEGGASGTPTSGSNAGAGVGGLMVKELSKESVMLERSRKRKGAPLLRDCFKKTIAVKRLEPLSGASSVHPLMAIDWDNKSRIGSLPGSDIKFIINAYGALQVYEGDGSKTKSVKPTTGMDTVYSGGNESSGKDDFARCVECECYSLQVEFIEEMFCSPNCRDRNQTRKALMSKRALAVSSKENTLKKRRLLEMALNKTSGRPADDNPQNNSKTKLASVNAKDKTLAVKTETKGQRKFKEKEIKSEVEVPDLSIVKEEIDTSTATQTDTSQPSDPHIEDSKEDTTPSNKEPPVASREPDRKVAREKNSLSQFKTVEPPPSIQQLESKDDEGEFEWCSYLSQMRSHPAWVRLFKDAFPSQPNLFRVGHRLEAIDPQRPSLFCAVSVCQVKGYRVKLHFEGYNKIHDFWLNADSPNMFPCGFCQSHGIELEPPWGFSKTTFNWSHYLNNIKARPAPPKCFVHKLIDSGEPNMFQLGMKLEAVDKKNSNLVCVATVAAVVDHRILVHFDSWDDTYDYWTEYYSPNIHPVGWCQRNNYTLTPPNGYKRKNFSWKKYLSETGAEVAPECAFMVRPAIKFKKGSKLEAVDPRASHLLRVATIKQVLPYQVHVVFDGFPDHFGFWFDDDSPDLHPIGWGARTGHSLSPPPKPNVEKRCSTPGCYGDGNTMSNDLETHTDVSVCPYSMDNLEECNFLPDRLSPRRGWSNKFATDGTKKESAMQRNKRLRDSIDDDNSMSASLESSSQTASVNTATSTISSGFASSAPVTDTDSTGVKTGGKPGLASLPDNSAKSSDMPVLKSLILVKMEPPEKGVTSASTASSTTNGPVPSPSHTSDSNKQSMQMDVSKQDEMLKVACDKFVSRNLSSVISSSEVEAQDLLEWDSRKVTAFVEALLHRATNSFYNNKVDGEGLLMLNKEDLFKRLSFNQSEASTIYSNILSLRTKFSFQS